jgi:hypothetical protein
MACREPPPADQRLPPSPRRGILSPGPGYVSASWSEGEPSGLCRMLDRRCRLGPKRLELSREHRLHIAYFTG